MLIHSLLVGGMGQPNPAALFTRSEFGGEGIPRLVCGPAPPAFHSFVEPLADMGITYQAEAVCLLSGHTLLILPAWDLANQRTA